MSVLLKETTEQEKLEQFIARIEAERKLEPMIGCQMNIEIH